MDIEIFLNFYPSSIAVSYFISLFYMQFKMLLSNVHVRLQRDFSLHVLN